MTDPVTAYDIDPPCEACGNHTYKAVVKTTDENMARLLVKIGNLERVWGPDMLARLRRMLDKLYNDDWPYAARHFHDMMKVWADAKANDSGMRPHKILGGRRIDMNPETAEGASEVFEP